MFAMSTKRTYFPDLIIKRSILNWQYVCLSTHYVGTFIEFFLVSQLVKLRLGLSQCQGQKYRLTDV